MNNHINKEVSFECWTFLFSGLGLQVFDKEHTNHHIQHDGWEKKENYFFKSAIENEVTYDPWAVYDQREKVEEYEIIAVKNSESQTDSADGVDFDWDLMDKTDIETQVITKVLIHRCI